MTVGKNNCKAAKVEVGAGGIDSVMTGIGELIDKNVAVLLNKGVEVGIVIVCGI
jgi:hypothetical protein